MAVFGSALYLNNQTGTIVFIGVLIAFLVFETLLHVIEVECTKRGFKLLIKKLYREFMILGFISFAIFIATEANSVTHNKWFEAFDFAHIIILFIGLTFLILSILLILLVSARNKTLVRYDNTSIEELVISYVSLHKKNGILYWLFHNGPISIAIPEIREAIEYKVIQDFFVRTYNLPNEFNFGDYMTLVLKNYVISLVEVRPISWLILSFFVFLNYLRIILIDPIFQSKVCQHYPSTQSQKHGYEKSSEYGDHVCNEYTLRYIFFCGCLIFLYLVCLMCISEIYIQRLLTKILDQERTLEMVEDLDEECVLLSSDLESGLNPGFGQETCSESPRGDQFMTLDQLKGSPLEGLEAQKIVMLPPIKQKPSLNSPREPIQEKPVFSIGIRSGSLRSNHSHQNLDTKQQRFSVGPRMKSLRSANNETGSNKFAVGPKIASLRSEESFISVPSDLFGPENSSNSRFMYIRCLERLIIMERIQKFKEARRASMLDHGIEVHGASNEAILNQSPTPNDSEYIINFLKSTNLKSEVLQNKEVASILNSPISNYAKIELLKEYLVQHEGGSTAHPSPALDKRHFSIDSSVDPTIKTKSKNSSGPNAHKSQVYDKNISSLKRAYSLRIDPNDLYETKHSVNEEHVPILQSFLLFLKSIINALVSHHLGFSSSQLQTDADFNEVQNLLSSIFLFNSPDIYYHAVELALLIQCVYIAFWATNLLEIAYFSYFQVLWEVALVLPLPINFFFIKQIIYTSCMIKSIVHLDKYISDKICENALDERYIIQKIRKYIRNSLKELGFDRIEWNKILKEKFESFEENPEMGLSQKQYTLFLHSLHIFLKKSSIETSFKIIDFDRDGKISWEDLSSIAFPELFKHKVKMNNCAIKKRLKSKKPKKVVSFYGPQSGDKQTSLDEQKQEGLELPPLNKPNEYETIQSKVPFTADPHQTAPQRKDSSRDIQIPFEDLSSINSSLESVYSDDSDKQSHSEDDLVADDITNMHANDIIVPKSSEIQANTGGIREDEIDLV